VAHGGKYSLRLIAVPENPQAMPNVVPRSPVTVTTPAVLVRSGQVVHISGWMKLTSPVYGSLDGVVIYDSQSGPVGALRFDKPGEWKKFSLVREVQQSGELTVTMSLTGLGEVLFDDIVIIPHDPRTEVTPAGGTAPEGRSSGPLDLLNRFPRIRTPFLPRKQPAETEPPAAEPAGE
jgi:hypothetical protein